MENQATSNGTAGLSVPDTNAFDDGIPWHTSGVKASLERVASANTPEKALMQATMEQVVLLHSVRRILLWTLVLLPVILTAIGIILIVVGQASGEPTSTYP